MADSVIADEVLIEGPAGCADTLTWGGKTYRSDAGIFRVPPEALTDLYRHGFVLSETIEPKKRKVK